jgi:hypothetical protein
MRRLRMKVVVENEKEAAEIYSMAQKIIRRIGTSSLFDAEKTGSAMKNTADMCLRELYGYDYDHALDYRDGLETKDLEFGVIKPGMETWENVSEQDHRKVV